MTFANEKIRDSCFLANGVTSKRSFVNRPFPTLRDRIPVDQDKAEEQARSRRSKQALSNPKKLPGTWNTGLISGAIRRAWKKRRVTRQKFLLFRVVSQSATCNMNQTRLCSPRGSVFPVSRSSYKFAEATLGIKEREGTSGRWRMKNRKTDGTSHGGSS